GEAQADGYYGYDRGYYDYGYYDAPPPWAYRKAHREHRRALRHQRHHRHHHHKDDDDEAVAAIAGAVIGLAIGAIIANESNRYDRRSNRYRSYATPPQPQRRSAAPGPQVAHQWTVAPEPFTDKWYDYCADKYRSFDAETGTFQPYEGPRKLCR
ncbi:MAG: BA14K family protein, partial [Pseudomonadota bacterium]